jgi:hypothetical protein
VQPAVGRRSLAVMLGGLSLLGPLSIDAYLPAFADIQRDFQASGGNCLPKLGLNARARAQNSPQKFN